MTDTHSVKTRIRKRVYVYVYNKTGKYLIDSLLLRCVLFRDLLMAGIYLSIYLIYSLTKNTFLNSTSITAAHVWNRPYNYKSMVAFYQVDKEDDIASSIIIVQL